MNEEKINSESTEKKKENRHIPAKIVTLILSIGAVVIGIMLLLFSRQIFGDEIGDAILGKDVPNGFVAIGNFFYYNAGALIGTLITLGVTLCVVFLFFFIINLTLNGSQRTKTIGSLLKSLIKYAAIITDICVILGVWGVNVAGIFAGLGVLSLIIGLGCKTLVNDIVSGFFIVVDNYFQVGDKVIIEDFTGVVYNIGLRTTKIKSWDGNIQSINNSLVTKVINLSSKQSVAVVYVDLSFNEDLKRAEAIIIKNLPTITSRIPQALGPVKYVGVDALDDCGVKLIFNVDVIEFDRVGVQRKLLRELYLLFVENDLIIPFRQIVVNAPDPIGKPRANKEEILLSDKNMYPVKEEADKKKKKSGTIKKYVNAYTDTSKEME